MKNRALVLDLDDTLYAELDFLKSAYRTIAEYLDPANKERLFERLLSLYLSGENVFDILVLEYSNISKTELLEIYRYHLPDIQLYPGVISCLQAIEHCYKFAMITDGRSKTQRNKIQSLGLSHYLDEIIISEEVGSEKPTKQNYLLVEERLNCMEYIYVGDNLRKDFITPNQLGWKTICLLDNGQNIHKQNLNIELAYRPQHYARSWYEILEILK